MDSLLREAIRLTLEMRGRAKFKALLQKYPNVPPYVLHDIYAGDDDFFAFKQFNRLAWKKQVLELSIDDFCPDTQERLRARGLGDIEEIGPRDDLKRTAMQRRIAADTTPGHNEPVIMIKRVDGYDLWEGWHRVMALLKQAGGGPAKINAWVGSSRPRN